MHQSDIIIIKIQEILGEIYQILVKFGQLKYNDSEKWERFKSKFSHILRLTRKIGLRVQD